MSFIESLMNSAMADTDVLRRLDADGDDFSVAREVDFHFLCPSKEKAEIVAGFLNDYQFGVAKVLIESDTFEVHVVINTPVNQNIILSISGFMNCVAKLFEVEFDGWGCSAQNDT